MEAITTSILVILLIFGLGLTGASYNQCQDTLSSNGYNLSDRQLQSFYEAANDPDNISYINNHSDSLSSYWSDYTSGNTSLTDWYDDFVINASGNSSSSLSSVDSKWVENSSSTAEEKITVWDDDLRADAVYSHFGKNHKIIEDGHGGYYVSEIVGDSSGANVGSYILYHYDAEGNCYKQCEGVIPFYSYGRFGVTAIFYDFYVIENADGSQTAVVTCTKTTLNASLEPNTNTTEYDHTYYFTDTRTGDIVERKSDSTTDLTINPDGSVTLPDGTVIYPNEDGSYTINGTVYYPTRPKPDVPDDINDLLRQLLDLQDTTDELEDELELDEDDPIDEELEEEISEAVDDAASSYSGNLSEFLLNNRITQIFPFCLPFDFVRGIKLISKSPTPPKFAVPFEIPAFGAYPGTKDVITLDFSVYSKYFTVVRWVTTVLFIISLTFLTYKLIKW